MYTPPHRNPNFRARERGRGTGDRGGRRREYESRADGEPAAGNWRTGERGGFNSNRNSAGRGRNGNQQQRRSASHGPRPERTMGFRYLENLVNNEDIQQVMLNLSNDRNGFGKLLNSGDMTNDMVILLTKLLRNVCGSTFLDVKVMLLGAALDSRFMEKLTVYITSIISQSVRDKFTNKHFWNDPDEFWTCLITLSRTVLELTPSKCDPILNLLKNMTIFFPLIETSHSMHISDEIKTQTASLLDIVEKTIRDIEVKKLRRAQPQILDDEEPPDDFRHIEIIPRAEEVVTDHSPFLRANIVDRAYSNVNQYLDIQFRLLREDFVAPLRRGISTYLRNRGKPKKDWKKVDDIRIYTPIRFLSVETFNECNCYKIRYDFSTKKKAFTYENSKRFMFGSLVCFTSDNFKSLLFGKIVGRDVKLLEQGLLVVGFQEDVQVNYEDDYLMVESSVFFEPYYQVLGVLKRMDATTFPMEKYIINVETDSLPPKYLVEQESPVMYTVEKVRFWSLDFPRSGFFNLNDSQLSAFRAALTQEFCIIQGPPGTGKTYLGLRIAHTLLHNRHAWYHKTPILVICYTNHALDQFLEGILPVTDNVLRVGGQSKNEALKKYNLNHKRITANHQAAVHQKRREVRDYMEQQKTISDTLSQIDANEGIISFNSFQDIVENYRNTWFSQVTQEDIRRWLLEGKSRETIFARNNQTQALDALENLQLFDVDAADDPMEVNLDDRQTEWLDDVFSGIPIRGYKPMLTLQQLRDKLGTLHAGLVALQDVPDQLDAMLRQEKIAADMWDTETDLDYLQRQLEYYQEPRNRTRPRYVNLQKPSDMGYADRWRLYYSWLDQFANQLRRKYEESGAKFREVYRVYNEMRDIEDTQLMKEHLVIGMTTSGAARLQSSLQALRSPIVIVEEAAEVLEAHIVAALTNHCKHLILIGDHLQLKPGAADYRIETRFKLGISLFERMVNNNIQCHTLNVQHRMRPEISNLIKPHIYPHLEDHESTLQRQPILGVEKCLYFVDHQEPEEMCQDASKKNIHESKFLIALARHLVLNGYKPEQITILAAYLGQFFEMMREKKKPQNRLLLQDVRLSVLDNYQGEECDIILLSLVRSNLDNNPGFLKTQNRVCVALSRARDGFYISGNMSMFLRAEGENQIWKKVKAVLDEQNAIGTHLTLSCQVHLYRLTQVSTGEDFMKLSEGGCDLLCEAQIACGHVCKKLCHVQDRDHELYKCNEKCSRLLCNDPMHLCLKRCYEDCGPCTYLMSRHLDCGHLVDIACHIDPDKYSCQQLVLTKLPCDHETWKPCSADPVKFKCPFPCDTRVEPCGHGCERLCHIRVDPDHLQYKCPKPCAKPRVGCKKTEEQHICTKLCWQDCEECVVGVTKIRSCEHAYKIACKLEVEDVKCKRRCKKTLPCGHPCKRECFEKCGPCEVMVAKTIADCGHTVKVKCHQTPERAMCKSKICPRLLPCGHKCTKSCKSLCTGTCRQMVECNRTAPCGHVLKKIMCHFRDTHDPKTLLKYCTEPCKVELKCKHECKGTCGECKQSRIHKRCTEKCGVPLVCNHECPIPCRQACKPCNQPCGMKCIHSKCKKKCGEPCTPCKDNCRRKCLHVQCTRVCGAICNVKPCEVKCPRTLKCGHPCVGFCGDPCPPLCRICDEEDLTEIFFGTEDDEDATFVLLKDCNHVLEHTGLKAWLDQDEDRIQFKTCPKCKTNITTTERYSEYVKRALADVIKAKEASFGKFQENEVKRRQLLADVAELELLCQDQLIQVCPKLNDIFEAMNARLMTSRNQRRQPISNIELNAIKSKTQTLSYIIKCFKQATVTYDLGDQAIEHMGVLLDVLLLSEDHVTNQEIEDLEMEIKRLHRIVQFDQIQKSDKFRAAQTNHEVKSLAENVRQVLFVQKRYSDFLDNAIKINMKDLAAKVDETVIISDTERMEIVKAMRLAKGHWYKCPNGHIYAIGECGGANQIAKCHCGAQIGGTNHHLLPDNQHAGEMDGSTRHAWPGGLH